VVNCRNLEVNYLTYLDSPVGRLSLYSDGEALTGIYMESRKPPLNALPGGQIAVLKSAAGQLKEYFAGARRDFDLAVTLHGTAFQQKVWEQLKKIPYGETLSYGQLAMRIGQPTASRAVGLANGRNPVSIVIPCHRVIGADGSLTGYGGGIQRKEWLLEHERNMAR
jgi:methylated-DNA-[protein]-cysteine S-methyltransferase